MLVRMPSAAELLAARARRVTAIRQRVIASVVASFVLFWSVVAWNGSTGAATSTAEQATTAETTTSTESTDPYSDESPTDDDGASLSTSQS